MLLLTVPRPPIALMVPTAIMRQEMVRHDGRASLQVDVHAAGVGLGGILQAELLAHLFDFGFDFLDVAGGVVAFAYDAG